MNYHSQTQPYATAYWRIVTAARDRGLIHGMEADRIIRDACPHHGSPAETAMFLRALVEDGVLRPIAKDLAGAGHSVRAFRGLQRLRETEPERAPDVAVWLNGIPCEAAEAHLWTFEAVAP